MIKGNSTAYWSVGITVRYGYSGQGCHGWGASLGFLDDGFCDDNADTGQVSTQGTLNTRYFVSDGERVPGLSMAVDALIADVERLGIQFNDPTLYYEGDGDDPEWPPPDGWKLTLAAESARIGWKSYDTEGR